MQIAIIGQSVCIPYPNMRHVVQTKITRNVTVTS